MKRKKKRKKGIFILFLLLFIAIFITLYSFSNKMMMGIGEASYQGVLSSASYYAIEESLTEEFNYEELFSVHKKDSGEISMITTDSYKFNSLTTTLADYVGSYLSDYINEGVDVPLGVFTGIKILQGFGKPIKMKLVAINSVKCDVISKFESAGINQTRHTLYLNITPDVSIVTRFSTKNVSDKITVMLYDNLIIGEVPEVYLSGTVFSAQKWV